MSRGFLFDAEVRCIQHGLGLPECRMTSSLAHIFAIIQHNLHKAAHVGILSFCKLLCDECGDLPVVGNASARFTQLISRY